MVKVQLATKIKFEQAVTTLKKFVAKSEARPVLNFIYFDGTHLIATDSHKLIRIHKNVVDGLNLKKGDLYDPKTKKIPLDFEGSSYPNVSRLIPNAYDAKTELTLGSSQLLDFKQHLELAHILVKKMARQPVKLNVVNQTSKRSWLEISAKHEEGTHYEDSYYSAGSYFGKASKFDGSIKGDEITLWANAQYLLDALSVVKKFATGNAKLYFYGQLKPMLFSQENVFDVLVLPIRKG